MRKVFGVKVDEFAEAAIFSLAWTAGLTSAYVSYFGMTQIFLAAAIFLFFSSVGMYYFLKLEAHQKAKRDLKKENGYSLAHDSEKDSKSESATEDDSAPGDQAGDYDSDDASLTTPTNN